MSLLHTIIAFIVALGLLVIVHELGHYWVARWCGVKVLRFSVGMGKVVYSRKIGPDQTEWAVSILPLGGYVKMLDAREQDVSSLPPEEQKREFTRQSVWRRMAIVAAGPLANFLLAIALFAGLFMHGIPEPTTRVRAPAEQSAAYKAGLRGGDLITSINGEATGIWSDLRWKVLKLALEKQPAQLTVERRSESGSTAQTISLPLEGLSGQDLEGDFLGKVGIAMARPKALLGKVLPDGPAEQAGLQSGDVIVEVNGRKVADGLEVYDLIQASPGKPMVLKGWRGGDSQRLFEVSVTPEAKEVRGQVVGKIRVEMPLAPEMTIARSGLVEAISKGIVKTWETSVLSLKMFGKMLVGEVSWRNITGPITIADYAGQTARIGLVSYLSFIAFISISLGVMNLLPIPVLDGGHLLYYSVEIFAGKPVSERFAGIAQRAGLGILMTLMMVAFFNDIVRLAS